MKVIKFPEHKIRRKWLLSIQNSNKTKVINYLFSFSSVIVGLAIVWFILHKMNA